MNISNWITRNASFSPEKPAIRFEGEELSYKALDSKVKQVARVLKYQLSVGRGDRVALLSYNNLEYLILLFACARLGAMLIPLNWRLATPEHLFILQDASAKVLVLEKEFASLVQPACEALPACQMIGLDFAPEQGYRLGTLMKDAAGDSFNPHVDLDSPLLIVYTSGTTGHPKGAVLTQTALQYNALNSLHMHNMTSQDHILTVLPMFHVGGLNIQTTPALYCGATVTLHSRFHPDETLKAIDTDGPTITVLVPTTMQACINSGLWHETDFSSLRLLTTGSTTVPGQLSDAFRAKGVPVLEVYGSTETCPIAIYQRLDSDFSKRGSTGLSALHCETKIIRDDGAACGANEVGEILIKGPNIMYEYWGNEKATRDALKEGWYYTGDIAYQDEDGYVFVKDRKKNMIISGGENIYPAEVERVLLEHTQVKEIAVIGVPDTKWQEIPVAVVSADCTEDDLRTFMAGKLAKFKLPKRYIFMDDLPKNAMGKVQHFRLREQVRLTFPEATKQT